jgi:hypothetical protein
MSWKRYELFYEAYDHSRRKSTLQDFLVPLDITIYSGKTFEEIFTAIHLLCSSIRGLGMLAVYDITAALCRYYHVVIDRVYIIGGGPKRAVKLRNLKTQTHCFNNIRLVFVEIDVVNNVFDLQSSDGDALETFLCKWQKSAV